MTCQSPKTFAGEIWPEPLIDIKLENVVLDELHLILRVTGMQYFWINNIFLFC